MANNYEANVVRYFKQKGETGYEPITFLGSEQRYITPLRNSGINNLEEQFVLGTDTYTEVYEDADGNIIVEKSFHVNSDLEPAVYNNYYKVKTTVYKESITEKEFYFDGAQLVMLEDINKIIFGNGSVDYPDLDTLYGVDDSLFNFNNEELDIYAANFMIVRKDELVFVTDNGATEKPVLTKTISKKYINGDVEKVAYREDIQNFLIS